MKGMLRVLTFSMCLSLPFVLAGELQAAKSAPQADLLQSCLRYRQSLTVPAGTPDAQRTLLALSIAANEAGNDNALEQADIYRQANAYVVYVKMSDTSYTWEVGDWVGAYRNTYAYNSDNNLTQQLYQSNETSVWTNLLKVDMTYDGSKRLSTSVSQTWSGLAWVDQNQTIMTYDGLGQLYQILSKSRSGGEWVNSTLSTHIYDAGRVVEKITQEWQGGEWVNHSRTAYTIDDDGNITVWLQQSWQISDWENVHRFTYTFVDGRETESYSEMWSGGVWEYLMKNVYSYDGSGHEILVLSYMWELTDWAESDVDTVKWEGDLMIETVHLDLMTLALDHTEFFFDGNGNEIENISQNFEDPDWINTSRNVFVYEVGLAVEVDNGRIPSMFELSQNYPNPFNPTTVIRYSISRRSPVEIAVFNLLGQEVKILENGFQSAGVYETTWDGTNRAGEKVASGIYFYRIKAGENVETRKMLLLK